MVKCKRCGKPVDSGVVLHSECYDVLSSLAGFNEGLKATYESMKREKFKPGDYIIYQNGNCFEIGKIKRVTDDGAFVWYHNGGTAAKTPFDCMHKLMNSFVITETTLGGEPVEV